ncbi:hypothetical protein QM012_008227 [Aureobasidium pullulans]|uniref:BTB domain-containing protein n=1 Tax=Aureobasidium pullulans TaxID=5580 RepID=A0ABR0TIU3_AURPU
MATLPSTLGAVTPSSASSITESGSPVPTNKTGTKQILPGTAKKTKQCCFNEPGGPWSHNVMLQAATCADMNERMMTLIVGKEETHFTWFHEDLSFHSSFFAGAMKYSWSTESKDKIVRMPEDSPDVFREFVRWITDHEVGGYGASSNNPSLTPWAYWDLMVELYIFGNKYNIPRLQNVAINEIMTLFQEQFAYPRASTIYKVYERTPFGVSLCRLVTDIVVLSHENVEALIDGQARFGNSFHFDFIHDLIKRLYRAATHPEGFESQRRSRKSWGLVSRCLYHVPELGARLNGKEILERCHAESLP